MPRNVSYRNNGSGTIRKPKVEHPPAEELRRMVAESPYAAVARQFGVSNNAVRKWCGVPKGKKKVIDRDLVVSRYEELQNQKAVAAELGIDQSTVRKILRECNVETKSSDEILRERLSSPVIATNPHDDTEIEFSSMHEAADYLIKNGYASEKGNGYIRRHIADVISGERDSAYGFVWRKA